MQKNQEKKRNTDFFFTFFHFWVDKKAAPLRPVGVQPSKPADAKEKEGVPIKNGRPFALPPAHTSL